MAWLVGRWASPTAVKARSGSALASVKHLGVAGEAHQQHRECRSRGTGRGRGDILVGTQLGCRCAAPASRKAARRAPRRPRSARGAARRGTPWQDDHGAAGECRDPAGSAPPSPSAPAAAAEEGRVGGFTRPAARPTSAPMMPASRWKSVPAPSRRRCVRGWPGAAGCRCPERALERASTEAGGVGGDGIGHGESLCWSHCRASRGHGRNPDGVGAGFAQRVDLPGPRRPRPPRSSPARGRAAPWLLTTAKGAPVLGQDDDEGAVELELGGRDVLRLARQE